MANKKISQLTAKGTALAATDLVEISESDGAGGYVTKSVTGANVKSGLQPTLVSATNIKTINSTTLLGSGDLAVQDTLVSATNIKTINSNTILGSGNLVIAGGQIVPAVSNTIGTTITGATIAMSDSVLIPAGTFSSNCQIDLTWIPSRLTGASGTMQGLIYINSTASLTGATLMGTSANMTTPSIVTNNRCTRFIAVRSNVATLVLTSGLASSDFSPLNPTETLPFNNSSDIYIIFAINNVSGVTTGRNVGYRIIGYNL